MDLRFPGRTTTLDQLRPGACFLAFEAAGTGIGLVVGHRGQRRALMLNRRHAEGADLALVPEDALNADVLEVVGAVLSPSRALADFAFGRPGAPGGAPPLYLGDGSAYLRGRAADGEAVTFDAASGAASAIDLAYLPRSTRWRVAVPEADGTLTPVFEAGPA